MLTLVFYTTEGQNAKERARQLIAVKGDHVRVVDASFWAGDPIRCDFVEVMPDVPGWQRKRIASAFDEEKIKDMYFEPNDPVEEQEITITGNVITDGTITSGGDDSAPEKKAVHRGGGRWFVMAGEEIVSGPHDKDEATRLAALKDEVHAA